jgi:hypothetical protein
MPAAAPPALFFVTSVFAVLSNFQLWTCTRIRRCRADAECGGQEDEVESRDGTPIKVDRAQVGSDERQLDEGTFKGDHYAKNL